MRHHIQSRGHLERHFRCLPLSLFKYFGPERVIMSLHREAAVIEKKKMNLMKINIHMELLLFLVLSKRSANIVQKKQYIIYIWGKLSLKSSSDTQASVRFEKPSNKEYRCCFRFQISFSTVLFLKAMCATNHILHQQLHNIDKATRNLKAFRLFVILALLFLSFVNLHIFLKQTEPYFGHLKRN